MAARWEEGDIERVRFLASNGLTGPEIAREMRRSIGSVRGIIERANVTLPTPEKSSFSAADGEAIEAMALRGFPLPVIGRETNRPATTIHNLLRRLDVRTWCGPGRRLTKITVALTAETVERLRAYGRRYGMTLSRTAACTLECAARDRLVPAILDLRVEVPQLAGRIGAPVLDAMMR